MQRWHLPYRKLCPVGIQSISSSDPTLSSASGNARAVARWYEGPVQGPVVRQCAFEGSLRGAKRRSNLANLALLHRDCFASLAMTTSPPRTLGSDPAMLHFEQRKRAMYDRKT